MFLKRLLSLLVLAGLLAGCSLGQFLPSAATKSAGTTPALNEIRGTVELKNPGQTGFAAAAGGTVLQVQGQVRTGADGSARLDLASGSLVRLGADTLLTLSADQPGASPSTGLKLDSGQLWISLGGGSLEVALPAGTASVRGSHMMVRVDAQTQDVWVDCIEGFCQAGNSAARLDLVAGQGALLHHFDPLGAVPPPAPELRLLSAGDVLAFLAHNPEAQGVIAAVLATASALPTLTPLATGTPPPCFNLNAPADGTLAPDSGTFTFTWGEQPSRFKYILTIIKPDGSGDSTVVLNNSYDLNMDSLASGRFIWKVTAYDANLEPICTAGPYTFTKPEVSQPTATLEGGLPAATSAPTAANTPSGCINLFTPADGASFKNQTYIDFSWSAYPGTSKYILTIKPPTTLAVTFLALIPAHRRYMESFPEKGTYQWFVTAKDDKQRDLCTSLTFTFTK